VALRDDNTRKIEQEENTNYGLVNYMPLNTDALISYEE
jgi:hypothetical protein